MQRQTLKPFLPRMVGTAGDGQDEARAYLALDWLVRTYTQVAGRRRAHRAGTGSARPAAHRGPRVGAVRRAGCARCERDAAAAWDAAGDAAWAAAWAAAWDAALAAALAAAETAWDAAWAAAGRRPGRRGTPLGTPLGPSLNVQPQVQTW